jgi:hypothetical protein
MEAAPFDFLGHALASEFGLPDELGKQGVYLFHFPNFRIKPLLQVV